jgi:hypothetical protein
MSNETFRPCGVLSSCRIVSSDRANRDQCRRRCMHMELTYWMTSTRWYGTLLRVPTYMGYIHQHCANGVHA